MPAEAKWKELIGYLDADGLLTVIDRKKDMIVTGGSNVYAREVEDVLLTFPEVREAAVIGLPHRIWGEAVTAVLVSRTGERNSAAIIDGCREVLAGYRMPKHIEWIDELPRNSYGKVLKKELRKRLAAGSAVATQHVRAEPAPVPENEPSNGSGMRHSIIDAKTTSD
ncbi:MAG: hypothetical protein EKK42_09405 [Pseudonocardiaceae bacterium]|nr:MAG: hypothetical protein EKK42_09405 [Pseudonocardiaceae bacterium]